VSSRLVVLCWLWLGAALLFVAAVAPAAFAVLPSRALAGLLVGRVLPVLFWSGMAVGLVLLPALTGWRRAAAALLVLACAGAQLGVAPRIRQLRVELGADIEAVDAADPRRVEFGRWHAVSVVLLGAGMLAAASLAAGELLRSAGSQNGSTHRSLPTAPSNPTQ